MFSRTKALLSKPLSAKLRPVCRGLVVSCVFANISWLLGLAQPPSSLVLGAQPLCSRGARPTLARASGMEPPAKRRRAQNGAEVLLLGTGGTIDKAYPRLMGGWAFEIGEPAAGRILERVTPPNFNLSIASVCKKDSQEITDEDREALFSACVKATCERIIVTHGTDTMVDTAQYLGSRHAEHLGNKRICLTGSMRPERFVDTDAHFNVGMCFGVLGVAPPGVYLCMNGVVHAWDSVFRDAVTGLFKAKE
mmetsp:Transcript_128207/g.409889  ORF Transcript_128207/g.409889 Transcript_128207/m.409889 type:complete len:250 (+) Transcript_128207:69-818(+)